LKPAAALRHYDELSAEEQAVADRLDPKRIPRHIAIIMDGNGRWARRRRMERFFGHTEGAETVRFVVETAARVDVDWITLYAFSLENRLRRPRAEVNFLMRLLQRYLVNNVPRMNDNNIQLAFIGRTSELPDSVQDTMRWAKEATAQNNGTTLTLALNYGAKAEIVDAAQACLRDALAHGKTIDQAIERLTEDSLARHLYTAHMPDPDLVIRTSGEQRISNFLLWQIAYSEIYVTERMWPDFRGVHLLEAIEDYQRRERRYGGLAPSATPASKTKAKDSHERTSSSTRHRAVAAHPADRA
jgi:undecaprenyl diphosphate synthase